MTRLSDTSPEAERVLRSVLRRLPFEQKWLQIAEIYDTARLLHAAGFRHRNPAATGEETERAWRMLQPNGPAPLSGIGPPAPGVNLRVVQEAAAALQRLGLAYALGGAWVCCLFGKMRYIRDAELWTEPLHARETLFRNALRENYELSDRFILHAPSDFKVRLAVFTEAPFERSVLARRRGYVLPAAQEIVCTSPEDAILSELKQCIFDKEEQEQHWRDLLGVLEVRPDELDHTYLDHWAADLGVADLLQRARTEAVV